EPRLEPLRLRALPTALRADEDVLVHCCAGGTQNPGRNGVPSGAELRMRDRPALDLLLDLGVETCIAESPHYRPRLDVVVAGDGEGGFSRLHVGGPNRLRGGGDRRDAGATAVVDLLDGNRLPRYTSRAGVRRPNGHAFRFTGESGVVERRHRLSGILCREGNGPFVGGDVRGA